MIRRVNFLEYLNVWVNNNKYPTKKNFSYLKIIKIGEYYKITF